MWLPASKSEPHHERRMNAAGPDWETDVHEKRVRRPEAESNRMPCLERRAPVAHGARVIEDMEAGAYPLLARISCPGADFRTAKSVLERGMCDAISSHRSDIKLVPTPQRRSISQ